MKKLLLLILLFLLTDLFPQVGITWTEISSQFSLPAGVKLFYGSRSSPVCQAWYLEVDLNRTDIAIKPYFNPVGKEGIVNFTNRFGAVAGINGGYFDLGGNASYSALVEPGVVKAKNIASVTRSQVVYYVTRAFFGFTETREFSVDWIYHFGNNVIDIYKYASPSPNAQGSPAPAPTVSNGLRHYELLAGLGGGPVLVKNGQRRITYDQEVFWGSGVGIDNRDPRSAVGFTADKKVIMLVADGRQTISDGLSLYELADVMIELGCVEAMNLDGGGSSQMAASGQLVNRPLGGTTQRTIPTMLAVVNADSINLLPPVYDVKKIDTGDSSYVKFAGTWTTSNLVGYWANTPAMIAAKGTGTSSVTFTPNLYKAGEYDVYAWWVAASNRAKDAPFIIKHKNGTDTVRADQSLNGSKWVRLGSWEFTGDSTDKVILGDFCTLGDFVVADAIRFLSFDSTLVSAEEELPSAPQNFSLKQNFPNPFNPSTVIQYTLREAGFVELKVYDVLGKEIATLVSEYKQPGFYNTVFDMAPYGLSSGTYFYRLTTGSFSETGKMLYLK